MRAVVVAVLAVLLGASGPAALAAWQDTVPVSGSTITAVTPQAPVVSCGLLQIGATTITWTEAPHARGYRLHYGVGGTATREVPASQTSEKFTGVLQISTFWVEALYGDWASPPSNSVAYTAVAFILGTCTPI